MDRIVLVSSILLLVVPTLAAADLLPGGPNDTGSNVVPPPDSLTPEMWLYLKEMQREDDPAIAVRNNARWRAAQRRRRLAALRWFGFSNQRPQANPSPFFGTYSPVWTGGQTDPYVWSGGSIR